MEVEKYLENLKTDCVILFLSQMMCGRCSPPCRREGGAWLRKEAGIRMLQPLAFALFWYRGRPEGEEWTLLVHLKNKEVFQLTGIYCLVLYCLVLIAWGGGGQGEEVSQSYFLPLSYAAQGSTHLEIANIFYYIKFC